MNFAFALSRDWPVFILIGLFVGAYGYVIYRGRKDNKKSENQKNSSKGNM